MAGLLYYVSEPEGNAQAVFSRTGLADRLERYGYAAAEPGPDGKSGRVYGDGSRVVFIAADQTWRGPFTNQIDNLGEAKALPFWIGFWNNDPPTPAELARPRQIRGRPVELGDERPTVWMIPTARYAPSVMFYNTVGTLCAKRGEVAEWLWETAVEIRNKEWTVLEDTGEPAEFDRDQVFAWLARLLSINYRVGADPRQEASLLLLFRDDSWGAIEAAWLDLETGEPNEKKKRQPEHAALASGPVAGLPADPGRAAGSGVG